MQEDLKQCELCGKRGNLSEVIIEGSLIFVCKNCAKFGKAVFIEKNQITTPQIPRKIIVQEEQRNINPEYPKIIKTAREKQDLKQKELAERIAEKESIIHQLESGHFKPTIPLAEKLEKFLNVKLIEIYQAPEKKIVDLSDKSLTIGDLVKLKKK